MKVFNEDKTIELQEYDLAYGKLIADKSTDDDIFLYIPFTEDERKEYIRFQREQECFLIINRGGLWYKNLTQEQLNDLEDWYQKWLDVTETLVIPEKPSWLKE